MKRSDSPEENQIVLESLFFSEDCSSFTKVVKGQQQPGPLVCKVECTREPATKKDAEQPSAAAGDAVAPAAPFGPLYAPVPATAVSFTSTDTALEGLVSHAAGMAVRNIKPFRHVNGSDGSVQNFSVMEEGAQFHAAWLETQPMAGGMYAARDAQIGLNNVLVFMRAQTADGFIPGQVGASPLLSHGSSVDDKPMGPAGITSGRDGVVQGLFFASPAVDVAWYLQQASGNNASGYMVFYIQMMVLHWMSLEKW